MGLNLFFIAGLHKYISLYYFHPVCTWSEIQNPTINQLKIGPILLEYLDSGGGCRGHDDVAEGGQERGLLCSHARLAAHRIPQLSHQLWILGKIPFNNLADLVVCFWYEDLSLS